jgi:predicted nucleic acid-binding protein
MVETDSPSAVRAIRDVKSAGGQPLVLDLAFAEVANTLWKHAARGTVTEADAIQNYADLEALFLPTVAARSVIADGLEIALKYRLAVYDAAFVAAARRMGIRGVTADDALLSKVSADYPEISHLRQWP